MRDSAPLRRSRELSLADVLTLANGVCGLIGVVILTRGAGDASPEKAVEAAAALVVAGALCDTLDGVVARRFGGGRCGEVLDMLSDIVTFGVLPAVMVVVADTSDSLVVVAAATLYFVAAAVRLARFRATSPGGSETFSGFASPAAAIGAAAIALLAPDVWVVASLTLLLGALMVSRLPYPKASRANLPLVVFWVALAVAAYAGAFPIDVLAIVSLVAVFAIPLVAGLMHARLAGREMPTW
jgi:CDP-diacylglycerol--serine O-phosphatidyltransferase